MELAIHQLDTQLTAFVAILENDLSKYNKRADIVKEQLNNISKRMDKMLDVVLEMDTDDEKKLDFKLKLLETLNNHSGDLGNMVMRLL